MDHRSRLADANASENGEPEAVNSADVEWALRQALHALIRASATFEAGKLVERPDEHPTRSHLKDLHSQILTIAPDAQHSCLCGILA